MTEVKERTPKEFPQDYYNGNIHGVSGTRSRLLNKLEAILNALPDERLHRKAKKVVILQVGEVDGMSISDLMLSKKGYVKRILFSNGTWCELDVDCDSD